MRAQETTGAATGKVGLVFRPLTPSRWPDLERLFGPRGACGQCWCMYWRAPHSVWRRQKAGGGNKRAFRALVRRGETPGLLAYVAGEPVGWCAVAPREATPGLERTRRLQPVDDRPVWSVTCFFIARGWRRRGVSVALLKAAAEHARRSGARIIEGYPVEPPSGETPDAFAWTGTAAAFRAAGFTEVLRRSPTRPIMRRKLKPAAKARVDSGAPKSRANRGATRPARRRA